MTGFWQKYLETIKRRPLGIPLCAEKMHDNKEMPSGYPGCFRRNGKVPGDGGRRFREKASCTVKVSENAVAVTSVTLNKTQLNLNQGGEERLTVTVNPSNATNKTIRWTSSNQAVASVSDNGTVRAIATGTATITASAHNNVRAVCIITVEAVPEQPEEPEKPVDPEKPADPEKPEEPGTGKILVAYFSWSGTSERIANNIIEQTGADSFRIERETPYSDNYNEVAYGEAKDEADNNARPPIKNPLATLFGLRTTI